MKTLSMISLPSLALSAIVFCSAGSVASRPAERPVIDAARPDTWEAGIKSANDNLSRIANTLISVAKDEKRDDEERRKAILLLGKIQNKESLDFLISNVSLYIPVGTIIGDVGMALQTPCKYALYRGDWNTAKAVLDALDQPRSETDLLHLSGVLKTTLTTERAIAIIDVEWAKVVTVRNVRKANLKILRTYMK